MNKNVFGSVKKQVKAPAANTRNDAGGKAYSLVAKDALTQLATTGTFNNTFYASAEQQTERVVDLCAKVDDIFLAKLAIYARQKGLMKDMPVVLLAILERRNPELFRRIFPRIVNDGKMIRNFIQVKKSGITGSTAMSNAAAKKAVREWFSKKTGEELFHMSIGEPDLGDIIRIYHPKAISEEMNEVYRYWLGFDDVNIEILPALYRSYEAFKKNGSAMDVPKGIPFQKLTALNLTDKHYLQIAEDAPWNTLRMNLNNFARHGVFNNDTVTKKLAEKLRDEQSVLRSKSFPYSIMTAYMNCSAEIPTRIKNALQDAMEISCRNVPALNGKDIVIFPDVSGSMGQPITGYGGRGSHRSVVQCKDVSALIASCFIRNNPDSMVMPFDDRLHNISLNPKDSVMTNAKKLAINGGSTNCALGISYLLQRRIKKDVVVYISDNESWVQSVGYNGRGSEMGQKWAEYKKIVNKDAKLVLIDLVPNTTTQVMDSNDVLNIGGFSDTIFEVIDGFVNNDNSTRLKAVDSIEL